METRTGTHVRNGVRQGSVPRVLTGYHLNSSRIVVDEDGTPVEGIAYHAYGKTDILLEAPSAGGSNSVREKFTGKEHDLDGADDGLGVGEIQKFASLFGANTAGWAEFRRLIGEPSYSSKRGMWIAAYIADGKMMGLGAHSFATFSTSVLDDFVAFYLALTLVNDIKSGEFRYSLWTANCGKMLTEPVAGIDIDLDAIVPANLLEDALEKGAKAREQ